MDLLPSGTVTFLITDLSDFTKQMEANQASAKAAVDEHVRHIEEITSRHAGSPFKLVGDAVLASFPGADGALKAALEIRETISSLRWPDGSLMQIKICIVTGEAVADRGDYLAPSLNRGSRVISAISGGQIVTFSLTANLLRSSLPSGVELISLGHRAFRSCPEDEFFEVATRTHQSRGWRDQAEIPRKGNLPPHPREFVGRKLELEELLEKLDTPDQRLISIVGLGGMGKTRLSIELGHRKQDQFRDGVWLVECSDLDSGESLAREIATVIGLGDSAEVGWERLAGGLRHGDLLLILDCFEGLIGEGVHLAELIHSCPGIRILLSSRSPLGVLEEFVYNLPPLSCDGDKKSEAVALFVSSAKHASHRFKLTSDNRDDVVRIVERMGGVPLGLQIAAALLADISPKDLLDEFPSVLDIQNPAAQNNRHQSLRHVIATSLTLVPGTARDLLCRLAVFSGSFSREDVHAVCPLPDGQNHLQLLTRLTSHSLVQRDEQKGRTIYRLLDSVREHVTALSLDDGSRALRCQDRVRHARRFADEAAEVSELMQGGRWQAGIELLSFRVANFKSAVRFAVECGEDEMVMEFCRRLARVYFAAGYWSEFEELAVRGLALARQRENREMEQQMLGILGAFAAWNSQPHLAIKRWEERLQICQSLGDLLAGTDACIDIAMTLRAQGRLAAAKKSLASGLRYLKGLPSDDPRVSLMYAKAHALAARVALDEERIDLAQRNNAMALKYEQRASVSHDEFSVPLSLAKIEQALGDSDKAASILLATVLKALEGERLYELALAAAALSELSHGGRALLWAQVCVGIHGELGSRELRQAQERERQLRTYSEQSGAKQWRSILEFLLNDNSPSDKRLP